MSLLLPVLLCHLLAAEPPVWTGATPHLRAPDEVIAVETAFATDFAPPKGTQGLTLPRRGAEPVALGEGWALELTSTAEADTTVWLKLPPAARGRWLRLAVEVAEGDEERVRIGPVNGTRPLTAEAVWPVFDPAAERIDGQFRAFLPPECDSLACSVKAGAASVRLRRLAVAIETRRRDQAVEQLAHRSGNLILNGGFDAGNHGFQVTASHPALGPADPPLPASARVASVDGGRSASLFVGDATVTATWPAVILHPGREYTFSFSAQAQGRETVRLGFNLRRDDGRLAGRQEVAVGGAWTRFSATLKTDGEVPRLWRPEIRAYPGEMGYAVNLDGLCLAEGKTVEYVKPKAPFLTLEDGLATWPGHFVRPDRTVTVKARLLAGADGLKATVEGELVSHLGAVSQPLTGGEVDVEEGVYADVELFRGTLAPGWYLFRARAVAGERELATAEQAIVCIALPETAGERLALRWPWPDSLFNARSLTALLGRFRDLGFRWRWIEETAVTAWAAHEPRPGAFDFSPLARTIDAGKEAGLGTVVVFDARPTGALRPSWLPADGPTPEVWARYAEALAKSLAPRPFRWAVRDEAGDTLAGAMATANPAAERLDLPADDWTVLPAPSPAGPRPGETETLLDASGAPTPWLCTTLQRLALAGRAVWLPPAAEEQALPAGAEPEVRLPTGEPVTLPRRDGRLVAPPSTQGLWLIERAAE